MSTDREMILVPAYGRDYDLPEQVLDDWKEGKDFQIQDISWGASSGRYTSCRDAETYPDLEFVIRRIRFNKLQDIVYIQLVNNEWKMIGTVISGNKRKVVGTVGKRPIYEDHFEASLAYIEKKRKRDESIIEAAGGKKVSEIHDSVVYDVPAEKLPEIIKEMTDGEEVTSKEAKGKAKSRRRKT